MTYIRLAAIGFVALALFFGGWYCGSLRWKAQLEHTLAANAATVATALLNQRKITDAEEDRLHAIITKYENAPVDPLSVNVGTRVYHYYAVSCPVSAPPAHPSGASDTPAVTANTDRVGQVLNRYVSACSKEANQLKALIEAWPK